MWAALEQAEQVLQGKFAAVAGIDSPAVLRRLLGFVCVCGVVYGTVMGSFGGIADGRIWQVMFSASKVPFLLLGTFAICLPSFFVLNTIAGLREDFSEAVRILMAGQAGMTLVLCSLAPLTAVWYVSSADYHAAILINGLAFGIASLATQVTLRRLYRPLVLRNPKHQFLLRTWLVLYIFVGIQLGWLLRPFVGQPDTPVQFFRADMWGNAYIEILAHVTSAFAR